VLSKTPMVAQDVAERLRAARKLSGLTLSEVAGRVGVSESTVSRWETGRREPDYSQLRALADLYNLTVAVLFGERAKRAV
jgi:transcriptional regulator with XRE-family HTH domain